MFLIPLSEITYLFLGIFFTSFFVLLMLTFNVFKFLLFIPIKLLFNSLENRGVSNVRINFGIVRGLDYYSGIVFEVFDKNSKLGALAGGTN